MEVLAKLLSVEHRDILTHRCKYLSYRIYKIIMEHDDYFNIFVKSNKEVLKDYKTKKNNKRIKLIVNDIVKLFDDSYFPGIIISGYVNFPIVERESDNLKSIKELNEYIKINIQFYVNDFELSIRLFNGCYYTVSYNISICDLIELLTFYVKNNIKITQYINIEDDDRHQEKKELYQRI